MKEERLRRLRQRKLWTYYPDTGPLRRDLYQRHMEFFRQGAVHAERLALCGNRVGKTEGMGAYEVALHLTGLYPPWWEGLRFKRPGDWWVAGSTGETTRDIVQQVLIGPPGELGTGMIPGACILRTRPKSGMPDAIGSVIVKHVSGGKSRCGFKSYDQGRRAFEGTKKQGVWFDEEPPLDVYTEAALRTAATGPDDEGGIMICTFTPMSGMSETVLYFLPEGELP